MEELVVSKVQSGEYVLVRARPVIVARPVGATALEPSVIVPWDADVRPEDELTTWFELRLVDEIGLPIDGVGIAITPNGPLPTDGSGVLRVDSPVRAGAGAELACLEELRARVAPRWNEARPEPWVGIDGPRTAAHVLVGDEGFSTHLSPERTHTIVVQPWVVRAQLDGLVFDTNKSFLLPDAVRRQGGSSPVDRVRGWVADHPGTVALVVGHTDSSGDPWFNDPLSLERADAFAAYLRRDVAHWLAWYQHAAPQKRWGWSEDLQMRDAVCERHGLGASTAGTRAFQAQMGLEVDGFIGPNTRRALVEAYMDLQDLEAELPATLQTHGCGENFPKMIKPHAGGADGEVVDPDQADHRRVELFLFPQETGVQPPPPGQTSPPGTTAYPAWVRRARHARVITLRGEPADVFILVVHELAHGAGPTLAHVEVVLRDENDEEVSREMSDDFGVCHFQAVSPGPYTLVGTKDGFDVVERAIEVHSGGELLGLAPHDSDQIFAADSDPSDFTSSAPIFSPPNTRVLPMVAFGDVRIVEFIGRSPSYPVEPPDRGVSLPDNFVYFGQGESVDLSFIVEAPSKPKVFIRRMKGDELFKEEITRITQVPGKLQWRGTVRYSLRKLTRQGLPNPHYAPPRFDGRYFLELTHASGMAEAYVTAAGIVAFDAIAVNRPTDEEPGTESEKPETTMTKHANGLTPIAAARGEKGNYRTAPFNHWIKKRPHGYVTPEGDYAFTWEVIGSRHVRLQLEVLGEAPAPKQGAAGAGRWALERQNDYVFADTAVSLGFSPDRKMQQLTSRANLNVFRLGTSQSLLSSGFGELPGGDEGHKAKERGTEEPHADFLGSSTLVVQEARGHGLVSLQPTPPYGAEDSPKKAPEPTVRGKPNGYYQAYEVESLSTFRGHPLTIELIERVRAIWAVARPDRPFGMGEILAKTGHESHGSGTSLDLMLLRNDGLREKRVRGASGARLVDGNNKTVVAKTTHVTTRNVEPPLNDGPFDFDAMQDLLFLFAQIARQGGGSKGSTYGRFWLDDDAIVSKIAALEPTSRASRDNRDGHDEHGWHAHLMITGL